MADNLVLVSWYEHECDWISKYCDETHKVYAVVPEKLLRKYRVAKSKSKYD